jgi:hypothetical protein
LFSPNFRVVFLPASVVLLEEAADRQTSEQASEEEEDFDSFFSHFAQTYEAMRKGQTGSKNREITKRAYHESYERGERERELSRVDEVRSGDETTSGLALDFGRLQ